ncbi:hypothetical protein VPH35_029829 [Triticum aestivum]
MIYINIEHPHLQHLHEVIIDKTQALPTRGLRIVSAVASDLLPLISAAVNRNLHRHCRHSEFTTKLRVSFQLSAMSDNSDNQNRSEEQVHMSEGTSPSDSSYDDGSRSTPSNLLIRLRRIHNF